MIGAGRDRGPLARRKDKDDHGRAHRARPTRVEPATFAWIEPLDEIEPVVVEKIVEKEVIVEKPVVFEKVVEKIVERPAAAGRVRIRKPAAGHSPPAEGGKTIIIGRGPSLGERLARSAPDPKPVLAGACALVIALSGIALISPGSERATASRSTPPLGAALQPDADKPAEIDAKAGQGIAPAGEARNPFAAQGYRPKPQKTNADRDGTETSDAAERGDDATGRDAPAKTGTPAAAKPSRYTADFLTYSSYTPWLKVKRRSGTWIEFSGKPTLKVVSVSKYLVELFVVTDVEVLTDKSRDMAYSYPLRLVKIKPGGMARFADYRDIQGEDVVYTIRFRGAFPTDPVATR